MRVATSRRRRQTLEHGGIDLRIGVERDEHLGAVRGAPRSRRRTPASQRTRASALPASSGARAAARPPARSRRPQRRPSGCWVPSPWAEDIGAREALRAQPKEGRRRAPLPAEINDDDGYFVTVIDLHIGRDARHDVGRHARDQRERSEPVTGDRVVPDRHARSRLRRRCRDRVVGVRGRDRRRG